MTKITTRDVAQAAGVSQSTVSFVMNDKRTASISPATREKVKSVASHLGYEQKKRAPIRHKTAVIGIMVPTLSNLYYPFLVQNIELYAQTLNLTIIIQNTLRDPENEKKCFAYLLASGVSGILCLFSPKTPVPEDIPTVIVGEKTPDASVDTVSLNSFTAGHMMADHLVSLGHQRIAYVSSPLNNTTLARKNRLDGIVARLAESGLDKYLEVIVDENEAEFLDSAYEFSCGRKLTGKLISGRTRSTAIIAVNDMTAAGCLSELNERGIGVPTQMAVCGFDNLVIFRLLNPQLTSVDQMAYHGSKVGLNILLEKINAGHTDVCPIHLEYEPHLFVRGSTVAAPPLTP